MFDFNQKIVLVTGASRGIGLAIMHQMAALGAFVIGTSTSQDGADKITQYLNQHDFSGCGMRLDVTLQSSIDELMAQLKEKDILPQILVNNAGVTKDNLLLRMNDEQWDTAINTNLSAAYRMSKACLKSMFKQKWGRIINIGSVVGASGNAGQCNYSAAKAGLIGFTKSLAQELGSRQITVNLIAPGFIQTDMTDILPEETKQALIKKIPLQKLGEAQDIAQAVAFLASDLAKYITGETLHVNGGMYMN